ncbi:MAG: hypothetical protein WAS73_14300 [Defluviicoccus sp.]
MFRCDSEATSKRWKSERRTPGAVDNIPHGTRILGAGGCGAARYHLHGTQSFTVAKTLQARGLPFALITSHGDHTLPDHLAQAPLLKKPFAHRKLAGLMARLSRRPA